jgi:hypothetical protein
MRYYRCRNCGGVAKAERSPGNVNKPCINGKLHAFQDLGEIGSTPYICKYCGLKIQTNGKPNNTNDCQKHDFHDWVLSSGNENYQSVKFDSKDHMNHKHPIHRAHLNLLDLVKAGAFGIGIIIFGGMALKNMIVGLYLTYPIQFKIIASIILILISLLIILKIKKKK